MGSNYSVVCRSSCDDVQNTAPSASIPLAVTDDTAPAAAVLSPNGGEIWVLSSASQTNTQTLTWSMSDNGLICKLVVNLLAVDANGKVQTTILLHSEDKGTACSFSNQVTTTFLTYTVQTTLPAAQGLFYKIEIDVTDQADHTTVAQSTNPFYMVNPATSDSVRTLILSNLKQMRLADADASRLTASLSDLANFANAPGVWFDLRGSTVDKHLLDAWGSCQSSTPPTCDAATANALVSAIRGYIGEILQAYPKLRYVVLVGDDRAIPFARVKDGTTGPAEQDYVPANLTDGSTVGSALEKNFYLSDDVVVSHSGEPFPEDGVDPVSGAFLPDLAVGRLVETPEEIIQTITNFIQQNGVLDLTQTPSPKVLVTGYDFLLDSARAIANDWDAVDSGLLGADWTAEKLKAKLANDHRLFFLNGHAAHFAEGVPGTSDANIPGLSAADIASLPAPGLNGGVVFAVGCHGGLTVPGSTDDNSADHSLDLPQTFLREGAVAYVANSGFGWGLQDGIGYSERLIQLLSDQMRSGGTIAVGDAVRAAKLSYFLQRLAADSAYDQKVLFEWTLFGLPMYAVKTGIAAKSASSWSLPPRKEVPAVEHLGPVTVTRRPATPTANAVPPRFLTQLDLAFDFSGGSVYKKHNAAGNDVTDSGCPQDANGCYYTLNGLSTGAAGLPILPYFVYDSRLSGTSQHGVLWLGGSYVEETGWKPVVAQLISNSGAQTSGGSLPYPLQPHPVSQGRPRPTGANACPASDLDPQSLVVVTGEIASMGTRHRRFDHFNAEILYYNNNDSRENCQQEGPGIAAPVQPYHQVNGSTVTWSVPVTAAGGADVWRVLVLYDLGPDSQGRGAWAPLELAPDGSGNWTGSLTLPAGRGLSYLIEAVSTHGNVGWLASGIEGVSIPTPTAVGAPPTPTIASPLPTDTFGVGDTVVLQGSAVDAQGGALPDSALSWTVLLHQGSQVQTVFGPASGASVSFTAPPPASFAAAVDGYLEIQLKATDAMGQSNTVSQRLDPARVALTFATQPAGLTLTINGAAMVAPQSVTSWRGYPIDLAASTQSGAGGQRYAFQSWSDGGGWSHTLVTPAAPATDTAVFLLSQTTGPLSFFTVLPCRVIDTRLPLGPMGSPSLSAGQVRYFTLPGVCKVPQTARAVAVNVTIVNPTGTGYLTIHPADQPAALTSVLNFTPGMVRANNAILYLGETGTFAVTFVGSPGTVDFVVDLVGFFE
ncbi:MAG TPA: C25 family cysteine peptidase [Thermoanaerobaculia bacterium]|nr:C25 family cysteine peptidase [Thermoanaerobaculia bacterium]